MVVTSTLSLLKVSQ